MKLSEKERKKKRKGGRERHRERRVRESVGGSVCVREGGSKRKKGEMGYEN